MLLVVKSIETFPTHNGFMLEFLGFDLIYFCGINK